MRLASYGESGGSDVVEVRLDPAAELGQWFGDATAEGGEGVLDVQGDRGVDGAIDEAVDVEGTRGKLKRLVKLGILTEIDTGNFARQQ